MEAKCKELGVNVALSEVWAKGGEGGMALAEEVVRLCEEPNHFSFSYEDQLSIKEKLEAIATKVYHADGVDLVGNAVKQVKELEDLGFSNMPICMAKTQYSFPDDASKLGAPKGFLQMMSLPSDYSELLWIILMLCLQAESIAGKDQLLQTAMYERIWDIDKGYFISFL